MNEHEADPMFTGSIPDLYERLMVPMIFECYADDLVTRVIDLEVGSVGIESVLEVAAGTGVLTRAMTERLPELVSITASDLNQAMVDRARLAGTTRPVTWRTADVMSLPFEDGTFDLVVCQFGVMFFPDRAEAFAEILRVLRPGGTWLFSTWDRIESNEFPDAVEEALALRFPDDPPRFMSRTPHGYFDEGQIRADLAAGGFSSSITFEGVEDRSPASGAEMVATAFCQGTPLRNEIESREPGGLADVTRFTAKAIAKRFGTGPIEGRIRGFVISAR